jgi:hypothetical protein
MENAQVPCSQIVQDLRKHKPATLAQATSRTAATRASSIADKCESTASPRNLPVGRVGQSANIAVGVGVAALKIFAWDLVDFAILEQVAN